jgi:uncharacterized membrane protein
MGRSIIFLSVFFIWRFFCGILIGNWKETLGEERFAMAVVYPLLFLFFCYSFLGWILETGAAAVRERKYVDRSALYGPLCIIYGLTAVFLSLMLRELRVEPIFLFLGSAIYATVIEWLAGHLLERLTGARWWDYSHHRANLDGYISLPMSILWGMLGFVGLRWGNPLLLRLYSAVPPAVAHGVLWVLTGLLAIDLTGSILTMIGARYRLPHLEAVNNRLEMLAVRLGQWILGRTEARMRRAHPEMVLAHEKAAKKSRTFAEGCCFYKLFLLLVIGAFLGDVTETIFCRISAGVWMSRSSLVWGPFSVVWGLAIMLVTLLLYRYRDRSDRFLFLMGTFLGGAYEYACSVFTERVFGTIFWDYSKIPFNLGGRINLLYCFFWGIAAVVWFKCLYPPLSRWIERIPKRFGTGLVWILLIFMVCNMAVSSLAMVRYSTRASGKPAKQTWEMRMDERFDDERMRRIYPNAIQLQDAAEPGRQRKGEEG